MSQAVVSKFSDAWLLAGQRTPFVDYASAFARSRRQISRSRRRAPSSPSPGSIRRKSGRSSRAIWLRPRSTPTCCRATPASIPACRSMCRRSWCSACAAPASRRSCRPPTWSRSGAEAGAGRRRGIDEPQSRRLLCDAHRLPDGRPSSRTSSGRRCSIHPAVAPWATPRKISRRNTICRARKSTFSPPAVSRAPRRAEGRIFRRRDRTGFQRGVQARRPRRPWN